MASTNPVFSRSPVFSDRDTSPEYLQEIFDRPVSEPMTIEDTVAKAGLSFALVAAGAVAGWTLISVAPMLVMLAALVGLGLGLINAFKREPSPALILSYAAAQGLFVGGISAVFEARWPGIVLQAVIASLAVVGVTLALFVSGKVRVSARANKMFLIAIGAYLLYALVNLGMSAFGAAGDSAFGLSGSVEVFGIPLGLIIGPLVILLGAYSLVQDFDSIQRGVAMRADKRYGWTAAFGITLSVLWLYLEILRFLGIAREQ